MLYSSKWVSCLGGRLWMALGMVEYLGGPTLPPLLLIIQSTTMSKVGKCIVFQKLHVVKLWKCASLCSLLFLSFSLIEDVHSPPSPRVALAALTSTLACQTICSLVLSSIVMIHGMEGKPIQPSLLFIYFINCYIIYKNSQLSHEKYCSTQKKLIYLNASTYFILFGLNNVGFTWVCRVFPTGKPKASN